jgi:hypothetical protein
VLPSAAAFFIGAVGVLWGLRTLPAPRNTDSAVMASREHSTPPGVATIPAPAATPVAVTPVQPAPVAPPPMLPLVAGMSQSGIQSFPQTRIVLPPAPRVAAPAPIVLARAATPEPLPAPTSGKVAARRPSQQRPTIETSAPQLRRANTQPERSIARRVETPALTPLASLSVRTESMTTIAAPVAELPRPSVTMAPPATLPAVAPAVARADASAEEYAVRRALHSYEEASEDLDVAATANVWPTVDRGALARAFATLKSQGLDFRTCSITVNETRAVAHCRGTVQFVRKVGNPLPLTSEQVWIFKMRRSGADWKIDQVSASPAPVASAHRVREQG